MRRFVAPLFSRSAVVSKTTKRPLVLAVGFLLSPTAVVVICSNVPLN
jgi:hypothetical protein